MMRDEDEDDPIVERYKVVLRNDLDRNSNLYWALYPLRSVSEPYHADLGGIVEAKIKPNQKLMSVQYDVSNMQDAHAREPGDHQMPNLILKGSVIDNGQTTNYAFCTLDKKSNTIYAAPVHASVRFTPDLRHIDDADTERAARLELEKKRFTEEQETGSAGEESRTRTSKIVIKFRRKESERAIAYRKLSHGHFLTMRNAEEWKSLTICDAESNIGTWQHEQLTQALNSNGRGNNVYHIGKQDFLAFLEDPVVADPRQKQGHHGRSSFSQQSHAPRATGLESEVKKLIERAHILPFLLIVESLKLVNNEQIQAVLHYLKSICHLIHGLWVLKQPPRMSVNELKFRNILLYMFHDKSYVVKRELFANMIVSYEDGTEICEKIATNAKWSNPPSEYADLHSDNKALLMLKYECDNEFIECFPDIAQAAQVEYEKFVITMKQCISSMSSSSSSSSSSGPVSSSSSSSGPVSTSAIATRTQSTASSSSSTSRSKPVKGEEEEEENEYKDAPNNKEYRVCMKAVHTLLKDQGIVNHYGLTKWLQDKGITLYGDVMSQELMQVRPKVYVLKEIDNAKLDPARSHILSLYATKEAYKKKELVLSLADAKITIADKDVTKILKEFAQTHRKSQWVLKVPDNIEVISVPRTDDMDVDD